MKKINKFKRGAASFYIVAISTLILVIIAASFAAVVISEVTRTSNDDLAQSAYDSALAGLEDAKLAYYNYQNCKESNGEYSVSGIKCSDVKEWVENTDKTDCDMVAKIVGRSAPTATNDQGVPVQEGTISNNMQQFYTCVTMTNKTKDILGTLSSSTPERVFRLNFEDVGGVDVVDSITKVRVKWYSRENGLASDFAGIDLSSGLFSIKGSVPPVISVGMIQTSEIFSLGDFEISKDNTTDRGEVYLVPYTEGGNPGDSDSYIDKTGGGIISASEGFVKSNDKTMKNKPFLIKCSGDKDWACEADIEIPKPVGSGHRNKETFILKVSMLYSWPSTDFSLEFFCADGMNCGVVNSDGDATNQAILDGVQISIDSTGRANDLYRRVETRLESEDISYPYPTGALQILGKGGAYKGIQKNFSTTCEYNFSPTCH